MIFVTVGTHEQPFDRLVKTIDEMKEQGLITEDVFVQTGYSTYEPKHCRWGKFLPYSQMVENVGQARIVITHGGPSSFIMPLQFGKTPIVVPRREMYAEHVNDHQVEFCNAVAQRQGTILVAEDMGQLKDMLLNYEAWTSGMTKGQGSNNEKFVAQFKQIVGELFS